MADYFLIHTSSNFSDSPNIVNWYGKFDARNIAPGKSHHLPRRELFYIRPNKHNIYTDIISYPFFMMSEAANQIASKYEKYISKQIVLLDDVNKTSSVYFLPVLPSVDCLSSESKLSLDRSKIFKAVLCKDKVPDSFLFKIASVKDSYVVAHLDLAESLLRRELRGIGLTPISISDTE